VIWPAPLLLNKTAQLPEMESLKSHVDDAADSYRRFAIRGSGHRGGWFDRSKAVTLPANHIE
jgi:hypothetical protein